MILLLYLFSQVQVVQGQLLSWTPAFPSDTSSSFSVTADASFGNKGLFNYAATSDVYVHTGVITNLSTSPTDWKYVKFNQNFNLPNAQLQAVYLGNNRWRFSFSGSLRNYYAVPAGETILKVAILFRSGNGSLALRNADGSDMYIPVYGNQLACRITAPFRQPTITPRPEPLSLSPGDTISIAGASVKNSNLTLFLNGNQLASSSSSQSIRVVPAPQLAAGNQTVILTANDGIVTASDTFVFYVPGPGSVSPLPAGVRQGINYEAGDTSVTLVLFAPGKQRVCVIGDFPGSDWQERATYQMNKTPDGKYWWLRITGLIPSREYLYQFLINGQLHLADPYAEKLLDPWNDAFIPSSVYPGLNPYPLGLTTDIVGVFQTAPMRYSWTSTGYSRPDKRGLVIYELLLRDFLSDHSWNRLADTLNYLSRLGVNAIELLPFNEFEGNSSWGYNPSFYFATDKYYGKANDLKRFVDQCHAKGIAVIMDIALNHSFGQSPMVRMYWDAVNNRPATDNPWFNASPRHGFSVGYDFNHGTEATRYFVSRVLQHWLQEYRLDGFRFDLSKGFTQRQTCDSNGGNCDLAAWAAYDSSRINILSRYYDSAQSYAAGSYVILEHFADNSEETVLSDKGFLLWGNMNYNYAQASMGYSASADLNYGLFSARGWADPHLVTYMESHDEERIAFKNLNSGNSQGAYNTRDSLVAKKRMEMSHVLLLSQPGPKMIWQFGELGYDYPINYCTNGSISPNCRTEPKPIRWDYFNQSVRRSLFDAVSHMNRLRNHSSFAALFHSAPASSDLSGQVKWIKLSDGSGAGILTMANFDLVSRNLSVSFPAAGTWYDYFNPPDSIVASGGNRDFRLGPGEYRVYINRFLPLPGTVISFSGSRAGFQNRLDWQVAVEQSVDSYELQRSFDSLNFTPVSGIAADGSGIYNYTDDISLLSSNVFYYRLRVHFADGSFRLSRIIRIQSQDTAVSGFSLSAAPNPFTGVLKLNVMLPSGGDFGIRIMDAKGRVVLNEKRQLAGGLNQVPLEGTASLASGIYFLTVEGAGGAQAIKLFKSP